MITLKHGNPHNKELEKSGRKTKKMCVNNFMHLVVVAVKKLGSHFASRLRLGDRFMRSATTPGLRTPSKIIHANACQSMSELGNQTKPERMQSRIMVFSFIRAEMLVEEILLPITLSLSFFRWIHIADILSCYITPDILSEDTGLQKSRKLYSCIVTIKVCTAWENFLV